MMIVSCGGTCQLQCCGACSCMTTLSNVFSLCNPKALHALYDSLDETAYRTDATMVVNHGRRFRKVFRIPWAAELLRTLQLDWLPAHLHVEFAALQTCGTSQPKAAACLFWNLTSACLEGASCRCHPMGADEISEMLYCGHCTNGHVIFAACHILLSL